MAAAVNRQAPAMLGQLVAGLADAGAAAALEIDALTLDSRKVTEGSLFLACAGSREHGAAYIDMALEKGAAAVLVEPGSGIGQLPVELLQQGRDVPIIPVADLRRRAGEIAERFYQHPSRALTMIGVTGTNGKTSVSHFIAQALSGPAPCGVIGTLGSGLFGALESAGGRTTPDPVTLHAELAAMRDAGAKQAVMEVSSHGLDQGRVSGVSFDVAVFTNLSHEHLDYHGDMHSYAAVKRALFQWPGLKSAVINLDDEYGRAWLKDLPEGCSAIGYSLEGGSTGYGINELKCDDLLLSDEGISFRIRSPFGSGRLESTLLGRFNAANLLAALGALLAVGIPFDKAVERLSAVSTVPGRMERYGGEGQPMVVVDYAHTPDALEHVLKALAEHCSGQLWCVFGCGGERDQAKRPMMGRVAERYADHVIVTNDNPRGEDPFTILEQILAGVEEPDAVYVLYDRAEAIERAIKLAAADDVVLIAGKGHESEQCVGDTCIPFSDREQVARALGGEVRNG